MLVLSARNLSVAAIRVSPVPVQICDKSSGFSDADGNADQRVGDAQAVACSLGTPELRVAAGGDERRCRPGSPEFPHLQRVEHANAFGFPPRMENAKAIPRSGTPCENSARGSPVLRCLEVVDLATLDAGPGPGNAAGVVRRLRACATRGSPRRMIIQGCSDRAACPTTAQPRHRATIAFPR